MLNNSIYTLQKRLLALFLLIVSIFFILIVRLFVIQIVQSGWLKARAASQWTRDLPINAKRGKIIDANNVTLAESCSSYDVYVRASMVREPSRVAKLLSDVIGLGDEETFKKVTNTSVSESLIKLQIDSKVANKLIDSNLKGVLLSENSKRFYPYGDLLTQVLGFTTVDNVGQSGIEFFAEKYLQGVKGYALEESDVNGVKIDNTLSQYIPPIDGCDISLTIDVKIQQIVEDALKVLVEEQKPKTATAIVMKANTGEIVAMSSKPSFDLNNPPRDNISELLDNVRNLGIVDVYEPGSTFKVLTTATALEEKVTTPNENFYDPGYRIVDGEKIKCWKLIGHGSQTMTEGLCNSCNSVFVDLALRLGTDKMYEYFDRYGFGDILGVDFVGEASGILMNKDNVKRVDLARMGFGQAIAVSPLQLIASVCSVVNGGKLYQRASPKEEGFQLIQSLYALGSGGFFGVGLFNSRQKYLFLPFSESDFIFSIIGEEMGFVGCVVVIVMYVIVIWKGIKIALNAVDRLGCYMAAGITSLIAVQLLINIAVVTGSIPPTGIPLPFISAGGTSLMVFMGAIGILLNISKNQRENTSFNLFKFKRKIKNISN